MNMFLSNKKEDNMGVKIKKSSRIWTNELPFNIPLTVNKNESKKPKSMYLLNFGFKKINNEIKKIRVTCGKYLPALIDNI